MTLLFVVSDTCGWHRVAAIVVGLHNERVQLVVLCRPRTSPVPVARTIPIADAGVTVIRAGSGDLRPWLAAVDAVFTCVSNCGADAVQLNRAAPEPLNSTVFLSFHRELRAYHQHHSGLSAPPHPLQELAMQVTDIDTLATSIEAALDRENTAAAGSAARRRVIPGTVAAAAVAARLAGSGSIADCSNVKISCAHSR